MTYPATIRTSVGQSIIGKVGRLFNGTATDVLNELLQNARRAGAKRVDIDRISTERGMVLRVRDDGRGIADPAKLLALGDSGWDDRIVASEDPAGMGVFSLAGRHVTVRSRPAGSAVGWQVTIPPQAWENAEPLDLAEAAIESGTEIEIDLPAEWTPHLDGTVQKVSAYYPVPVWFDGNAQIRRDFLSDVIFVEEWKGCRIGVFRNNSILRNDRINFHGLVVPCDLPSVSEVGHRAIWQVRVEIIDAPDIQLVLPARKEVIDNSALGELKEACTKAIFRAIARQGHHRLPFKNWRLAQQLGVCLPEASPWLDEWKSQPADTDAAVEGERIAGEPMILLPGNSPDMEQSIGRVLARGRPLGAVPVRPLDAFVGYGWYDDLPRVTDLAFQVALNGEVFDHHGGIELLPGRESGPIDAISLEVVVQRSAHPDANVEQLSLHADLLIALASGWGDVGEARVLFTPDCSIDASDLAWLLTDACFCPSDDCEADSYQTQRDVAETEARFIATNLLHGEDAALIERVRSATLA